MTIPTYSAESLSLKLAAASRRSRWADLSTTSGRGTMLASSLRDALLSVTDSVSPFGLRIRGAIVTGELDLSSFTFSVPLCFSDCLFESTIVLEGADLNLLEITESEIHSIAANGLQVRRDIDLSRSRIRGTLSDPSTSLSTPSAVWLSEAHVDGRLFFGGTRIDIEAGRAIYADRLKLKGNVRFVQHFFANGEIRFIGAQIGGSIDLEGATIDSLNGRALDLGEADIGGSILAIPGRGDLQPTTIRGRVELGNADIRGRVLFRSCAIVAPPEGIGHHMYSQEPTMSRPAIWAPRLRLRGDFSLEGSSTVEGGIVLSMADIGGSLNASGQMIKNPNDWAIDAASARIGGDFLIRNNSHQSATIEGSICLRSAVVGGSVDLSSCSLSRPKQREFGLGRRPSIDGVGSSVAGRLMLAEAKIDGGFLFWTSAHINGDVNLDGARITNQSSYSVRLTQTKVDGSIYVGEHSPGNRFLSEGLFTLSHVVLQGRLQIDRATFVWDDPNQEALREVNPSGAAIELVEARLLGGLAAGWASVKGIIDLTGAESSFLADDPRNWGDGMRIAGFTFNRFATLSRTQRDLDGVWDAQSRSDWLTHQTPFDLGPYEYTAQVMAQRGMRRDSEELLIAGRRQHRRHTREGIRARASGWSDWLFEVMFGYGYRPARAIFVLVLLFGASAVSAQLAFSEGILRASDDSGNIYMAQTAIAASNRGLEMPTTGGTKPTESALLDPCGQGRVSCFNPILFGADNVIPIVDLDQTSQWRPYTETSGGQAFQYWLALLKALGWTFSAVGALVFSRLGR